MRPKHKHDTMAVFRPTEVDGPALPTRPGILTPCRQAGQQRAAMRIACYQGFTKALPSVARACTVIRATARRGPLGLAASHTLEVLLQLLPRHCWLGLPVLRVTNATLASHVGCSKRQVQRHLAVLHERGVIGVHWGRGHARLSLDVHASSSKACGPAGIDLRPALAFAHEQARLVHAIQAAQRAFFDERARTRESVWQARITLIHATQRLGPEPEQYDAKLQRIEQLRSEIGRLSRAAIGGKAQVGNIEAATRALGGLTIWAHGLQAEIEKSEVEDKAEDNGQESSSIRAISPSQMTESNYVDFVVPTIQASCPEAGLRPVRATGMEGAHSDPGSARRAAQAATNEADLAAPLLYRRWLGAYDGSGPLPSNELTELEITARVRARSMGVAARVIEAAAERHGAALTIGAILFVATLPGRARVRSPAALLASLLQRQPGMLTPESFARRPHTEPPLDTAEALGIARRLAPGHQPHWVLGRWHATRQRRGEPITAPRSCLAAFARKLQREHAGHAG